MLIPAALVVLMGMAVAFSADASDRKLNVLFIAVDDLNDWTGFLGGYPGLKTPNLDRLAGRGTFFSRAYCSAPACNPSRASLLCGVRPSTSGVYHNRNPWRQQLPDEVTLPQHFMANGYKVWGGGKIFHGQYKDPKSWHVYFTRPADPTASWDRPVVTTHGRNNHAVRSQRWRYIRYADGSEELYDHRNDPMEWSNLAGDPKHAEVKEELATWLPKVNVPEGPRDDRGKRTSKKPGQTKRAKKG